MNSQGDVITDTVEDKTMKRIGSGPAISGNTFISYSFWHNMEGTTSTLRANFWTFGGDSLKIMTKNKDVTPELAGYGFGMLEGIAVYRDGSGILLKSNYLVIEGSLTSPTTDPTNFKYVDVRSYPMKTKNLELCPCPGWVFQFWTGEGSTFTPQFTHAHRNSDILYQFESIPDRQVVGVTCDGFSSWINIVTQDKAGKKYSYLVKRGNDVNSRIQSMNADFIPTSITTGFSLTQATEDAYKHELYLAFGMLDGKATPYLNRRTNIPLIQINSLTTIMAKPAWYHITGTDFRNKSSVQNGATKVDDMKLDAEIVKNAAPFDMTEKADINLDKDFNHIGYVEKIQYKTESPANVIAAVQPRIGAKAPIWANFPEYFFDYKREGNYILTWDPSSVKIWI